MEGTPFSFVTAGESHGEGVVVIVPRVPAGIPVTENDLKEALAKRRRGYGRGPRMKIETDELLITGGLRGGETTGNPFSAVVFNKERDKWRHVLHPFNKSDAQPVTRARPGHADLAGALKFLKRDIRDVIERASARETVARVVAGTLARNFLRLFGIEVIGFVFSIGKVKAENIPEGFEELKKAVESSEVACPDSKMEEPMKREIDSAREEGDTVGGIFKVRVYNVPPGLGSFAEWFTRLDAQLASAVMSIPGVKGVEIGAGFKYTQERGSRMHDEIFLRKNQPGKKKWWEKVKWFERGSNNAGGIEGGVSNGEVIELSGAMKPIPTLKKALRSIDIIAREETSAHYERSDVCVVPATAFVAENMVAIMIASAFVQKFGGDTVREIKEAYTSYLEALRRFPE